MACKQDNPIRDTLTRLLPSHRIQSVAREVGAVQRKRKIDIVHLVWTLILGFGGGSERTLAGLRRAFERTTGVHVVPSAFYDRFTKPFARLMKALATDVLNRFVPDTHTDIAAFKAFREVVAADSTVIRLHDLLKKAFPACRTNHTKAAAKLHVIMNVVGRGACSIKLTGQRVHDGPVLRAGSWVRDTLLLFDLGYYRFQLFSCIDRQGGYFLSRLKDNANPLITAVYSGWRSDKRPLVGRHLQSVLGKLKGQAIDMEIEVKFRKRTYGKKRSGATERFRLVGVWDKVAGCHHLYVTNIPVDVLGAEDIASLYTARWSIELFFRELKSHYRIDDLPSSKRYIIEALLYASILTLAASRALFKTVKTTMADSKYRLPEERWAVVFSDVAGEMITVIIGNREIRAIISQRLYLFLCHEAADPNLGRKLLLDRLKVGAGRQGLEKAA